jgi:hypothetical protein
LLIALAHSFAPPIGRRERGGGSKRHKDFFISLDKIPRATRTTEHTARWNSSDNAEFRSLVKRGYVNINNITPKFIESIRTRHGWENRSATNFRQNYRRVMNTL